MTAPSSIDPAQFLHEHLASASPDLLRSMLTTFINTNTRNGYRHRDFDTRAGTMDVAIPKLRSGSYFPDWLLERRRRAERALTTVVATCYLLGVSTRRMEKLVESLGITRLSKSQVSTMATELDAQVADFRSRPLDQGPYTPIARWTRERVKHGRCATERRRFRAHVNLRLAAAFPRPSHPRARRPAPAHS